MNDSALLNVDTAVIDDLVAANHILYQQGVVDGFGHVSARNPANPNHFLIARSMAPALVTADDIMEIDLDSRPAYGDLSARACSHQRSPRWRSSISPTATPLGGGTSACTEACDSRIFPSRSAATAGAPLL